MRPPKPTEYPAENYDLFINDVDFNTVQLVLTFASTILWLLAYVFIIRNIFKYKYVGIPVLSVLGNIGWEFVFSFFQRSLFGVLIQWGGKAWLLFDIVILWGVYKYGHKQFKSPFLQSRKWVYPAFVTFQLIAWTALIQTFSVQYADPIGINTGYSLNVFMSALFIAYLLKDPTNKAFSLDAAYAKWLGTAVVVMSSVAGSLHFNYEIQWYVVVCGILSFVLDVLYIAMLHNRKKLAAYLQQQTTGA